MSALISERRAADQILLAVEQHDFDRNIAAGDNVLGGMLRRRATASPSAMPASCARVKASAAVLAPTMRWQSCASPPAAAAKFASSPRSTSPRLECRSVKPCASLVILATPPAMVTRGHRMPAQIFEHAADEVAHVDQRDLRQAVELLHAGLGARAGGAGDVGQAGGARDFDAGMDRMNPSRARIGHDDAGGAEDRQAADDAEPAVERLRRQRFAAGNRNLDVRIGGAAGRGGDFGDGVGDHAARHRIDGGLARRQWAGRRA